MPATVASHSRPLRSPAGLLALTGVVLLVAAQFVRWGWYRYWTGEIMDLGSTAQSIDGFCAAALAAGVLLFVASRSAAESGLRIVQNLPLWLGIAAVAVAVSGYQQASLELADWHSHADPASFDVGMWLALSGAAAAAVAGAAATISRRRNALDSDVPGLPWRGLGASLAVGAAGAIVGLALWVVSGEVAGPGLGAFAVFLGPALALEVRRWFRGWGP